jgi:polar amino acid transport system substrate-binding protein
MKKLLTILLALAMTMTIIGGCSGEKTTMETIDKSGEMTFAMTAGYPPFNFMNEDGELDGFDIDIANALAKEMGVTAVPVTTAWDGIIGGLVSKRFDTIIGSMAITPDRLKEVNFTDAYYYDGAQFFSKSDTTLTDISDLVDGSVGVVTGTTYYDALAEMDNVTDIMQFESDVDNMLALDQDRIDGLVTGRFVGLQAPAKFDVDLVPVGEMLYAEEIGIAVRLEDTDLVASLNEALATIVENGTYEEISNKWFGTNILEKL